VFGRLAGASRACDIMGISHTLSCSWAHDCGRRWSRRGDLGGGEFRHHPHGVVHVQVAAGDDLWTCTAPLTMFGAARNMRAALQMGLRSLFVKVTQQKAIRRPPNCSCSGLMLSSRHAVLRHLPAPARPVTAHRRPESMYSPATGRVDCRRMALTCAARPTAGYRVVTAYPWA